MNLWDILIILIVAGVVFFSYRGMRESSGCGGRCGSCGSDCPYRRETGESKTLQ